MLRVMCIHIFKLLDGINSLPACCMDSAYLVCPGWPQDAHKSDLPFIRVEPVPPRPLGAKGDPTDCHGVGSHAVPQSDPSVDLTPRSHIVLNGFSCHTTR